MPAEYVLRRIIADQIREMPLMYFNTIPISGLTPTVGVDALLDLVNAATLAAKAGREAVAFAVETTEIKSGAGVRPAEAPDHEKDLARE